MSNRSLMPRTLGMIACVVAILCFILYLQSSGRISDASIDDVSAAVTATTDLSTMKKGDNTMVKRLYGIDPNEYDGAVLYYPNSSAVANELLVIKLANIDQQDATKAAIQARLDTETKTFNGYGVGQYEMLQNAVIDVSGNYVLFVVSTNPKEADAAFKSAL